LGIVMLFTGEGKGKTTAALGQVVRALGWGKKALVVQFLKGGEYGEIKTLQKLGVKMIQSGPSSLSHDLKEMKRKGVVKEAFQRLKEEVSSHHYDLIVLDEINLALHYNLLPFREVESFIEWARKESDILLTGRNAPEKLIEIADCVSEIREIKHHYDKGVKAKKGREF
jgi:cob(I)alamin adenosyltransferase